MPNRCLKTRPKKKWRPAKMGPAASWEAQEGAPVEAGRALSNSVSSNCRTARRRDMVPKKIVTVRAVSRKAPDTRLLPAFLSRW
jgi:hypothetical protein